LVWICILEQKQTAGEPICTLVSFAFVHLFRTVLILAFSSYLFPSPALARPNVCVSWLSYQHAHPDYMGHSCQTRVHTSCTHPWHGVELVLILLSTCRASQNLQKRNNLGNFYSFQIWLKLSSMFKSCQKGPMVNTMIT